MSDVVASFNEGVRGGDWSAYGACFTPDATVTFDGPPVPAGTLRMTVTGELITSLTVGLTTPT